MLIVRLALPIDDGRLLDSISAFVGGTPNQIGSPEWSFRSFSVMILPSSWAERESSLPLNRFSHNLVLSILHACVAQAIRVAIGLQQEDIPWKCGQLIGTEAYGRLPVMQEGRDKAHVERSRY